MKWLIAILILAVVLIAGCTSEYSSRAHIEEFNNLNRCQSDTDCVVGQEDVGTDIPSPEPQCVTKAVIDRFDNWFESKITYINCSCDKASNSCITASDILNDPIEECARVDGLWKTFNNGCVDSCSLARSKEPLGCTAALTDSCDCGVDRCWNGRTCEQN